MGETDWQDQRLMWPDTFLRPDFAKYTVWMNSRGPGLPVGVRYSEEKGWEIYAGEWAPSPVATLEEAKAVCFVIRRMGR